MKNYLLISLFAISLFGSWFDDIYQDVFKVQSCQFKDKNSFDKNWQPFIKDSDDAIKLFNKMDKEKVESSWIPFISTKDRIRQDFNSILDDVITTFTGDTRILDCLNEMRRLNRKIIEERDIILKLKEKNISGDNKDIKTEIKVRLKNVLKIGTDIVAIRKSILLELKKLGLDLNNKELEALLVRIDSDNIIQIMVIFDISKKITLKLEELMRSNNDNLKISKRYYGMNLILSEIALYVQDKYINSINSKYIPKLNKIISKVNLLIADTDRLLKKSSTQYERDIYLNNIKSQKLTVQTAKMYIKNLAKQKEQIQIAKMRTIKNLDLTRNSYRTMQVGSNLLNLIKSTQQSFNKVINIQFPEIIPFQNSDIEREYKRLTNELRD